MRSLVVDVRLPRDEYLRVYQTYVRQVRAVARDGTSVRFPVALLQRFLTHDGIFGAFRIEFDRDNRFRHIERL